jgi:hypothetical protein
MGPRCSSAETQVCHRSYIIAASFIVSTIYIFIPVVSGGVGRPGPSSLLCPGAYDAVNTLI